MRIRLPSLRALLVRDQHRVEAELRETKRMLETAQEMAMLGAWSWELGERTRIVWSPQAARIYGVEDFDGDPESFYALVHAADRERVRTIDAAVFAGEGQFDVEYRIVRANGEVRWIQDRGRLVRDEVGRPLRVSGVIQDVTERRA